MPRTLQTKTKTPKLSNGLKNKPNKGSTSTKILKNKKDTTQNGKANGRTTVDKNDNVRKPITKRRRKSLRSQVTVIKNKQDELALTLDTPVPTQMRFNRLMLWMVDPNNKYQWNREAFQSYLKSITMTFLDFLRGCDTVRSQSGMSGTMRPEHVDTYCGSHPEILKRFAAIEPCLTH